MLMHYVVMVSSSGATISMCLFGGLVVSKRWMCISRY